MANKTINQNKTTEKIGHCQNPCKECPFKKNSLRGWLGGVSVADSIEIALSESDFHCHMTRETSKVKHCAGRMLFASKTAKKFRNQEMEEIRLSILKNNGVDEILNVTEFKEHHKFAPKETTLSEKTKSVTMGYAPSGMRTAIEVAQAIAELTAQKTELPEFSGFGDNNWKAIDEAIRVIEEDISDDDIYDEYPDYNADEDEFGEDTTEIRNRMLDARRWLDGEIELKELMGEL